MKYYMVFDGRAILGNTDDASVVECFGEMTRKKAIKEFKKCWFDYGNCLYEFDIDGQIVKNGRLIHHDHMEG